MAIAWRSTFLCAAPVSAAPPRRATSAPPAEADRHAGDDDLFASERLYAAMIAERAEHAFNSPPRSPNVAAADAPAAVQAALEKAPLPKSSLKDRDAHCASRFGTASTTASIADEHANSDSDEELNMASFLHGIRGMTEALLQNGNPKAFASASPSLAAPSAAAPKASRKEKAVDRNARQQLEKQEEGSGTTFMICNLPCRVVREELVQVLEDHGLGGRYDYLHLPSSHRPGSNLGYAFVNLLTQEDADLCVSRITGYRFPGTVSQKVTELKPARLQGRASNIAQFGGSRRRKGVRSATLTAGAKAAATQQSA